MKFAAIVQFKIESSWLALDRRTRKDYALQMAEIVTRHPEVSCRWFDAEAWTGDVSDFVICEFEELAHYNSLWLALRDHPFLATPYARIEQVSMGLEREPAAPPSEPEPPLAAELEVTVKLCPQCQGEVRPRARFCTRCGHQMTAEL